MDSFDFHLNLAIAGWNPPLDRLESSWGRGVWVRSVGGGAAGWNPPPDCLEGSLAGWTLLKLLKFLKLLKLLKSESLVFQWISLISNSISLKMY